MWISINHSMSVDNRSITTNHLILSMTTRNGSTVIYQPPHQIAPPLTYTEVTALGHWIPYEFTDRAQAKAECFTRFEFFSLPRTISSTESGQTCSAREWSATRTCLTEWGTTCWLVRNTFKWPWNGWKMRGQTECSGTWCNLIAPFP